MMDLLSSPQRLAEAVKTQKFQRAQSGPQPLRFRSFDAFYQYYSKKQTLEGSRHSATLKPASVKAPVASRTSESSRNAPGSGVASSSPKEAKSSDDIRDPESSKLVQKETPTFTCTTEDYNVQGRVKRLCEIFQKAHADAQYRVKLENAISLNKSSKLGSARATTKCSLHAITADHERTPAGSASPAAKEGAGDSPGAADSRPTTQVYTKRDQNRRPSVSLSPLKPRPDLPPESALRELRPSNLSPKAADSLLLDKTGSGCEGADLGVEVADARREAPSPKAASPLKSGRNSPAHQGQNFTGLQSSLFDVDRSVPKAPSQLATPGPEDAGSAPTATCYSDDDAPVATARRAGPEETGGREADEEEWSRLERSLLIDDILDRFMNDPEFCDSFVAKLESLNLASNSTQLAKLVEELHFLVESGEAGDAQLDENRKGFEWFFNQPKVIDLEGGEPGADLPAQPPSKEGCAEPQPSLEAVDSAAGLAPDSGAPAPPEEIDLSPSAPDFDSDLIKHFDWVKLS